MESRQAAESELDRVLVQRDSALLAVEEASAALRQAKQSLGVLLNIPPAEVDCLELRGAISGLDVELPPLENLLQAALVARPDLNAYRLGVQRAQAEVQLARAERIADVFVLYTPWQLQDNSAIGGQNATSWSLGAGDAPVFNRNQGNISRARTTVSQTILELEGRERQIAAEVQRAYLEYTTTRGAVQRYENDILPAHRRIRARTKCACSRRERKRPHLSRRSKDYNNVVRQYLETAVRHRRSGLRLNTALGQRIVP